MFRIDQERLQLVHIKQAFQTMDYRYIIIELNECISSFFPQFFFNHNMLESLHLLTVKNKYKITEKFFLVARIQEKNCFMVNISVLAFYDAFSFFTFRTEVTIN